MKQTLSGLALAILLTACAAQNATTNITPDAWRADLRYLAAELPRRHVNAFHTITREGFADEVAKLDSAIPHLTNDESVVGLMRIVALVGDGHTHLDLPPSFSRYPIELHWFGDVSWRMAGAQPPPLYLRNFGQPWWTEFLPDTQTLYFSFNGYPPEAEFRERATALGKLLDDSRARRLVIDLRRNQGGDFQRFRSLLLPIIEARSAINRTGGLFVIIGPGTFSAAGVSALDLRNRAHAILVGAPAGIRPNHYGDSADFRLPNSGLRISYATQFHQLAAATDSEIAPDKRIEPTWEDFRAGRDPVMEWILSYTQ